jgi:hypothetical protein
MASATSARVRRLLYSERQFVFQLARSTADDRPADGYVASVGGAVGPPVAEALTTWSGQPAAP